MSRTVTPATTQPSAPAQSNPGKVPHDRIAMRAYEKWVKRGQPMGSAEVDWLAAEAELKAEIGRGTPAPQPANQSKR